MRLFDKLFKKIKYMLNMQTLSAQLKIWGVILIILPSFLIILVFSINSFANRKEKIYNDLDNATLVQKEYIENWLRDQSTKIRCIAQLNSVQILNKSGMKYDFEVFLKQDSFFQNIIYVNNNGAVDLDINSSSKANIAYGKYFQKALEGKECISDVYILSNGQPIMVFSAPVNDFEGQFQGMVLGTVSLNTIDDMLKKYRFRKTGEVYLVNQYGSRLTSPRYTPDLSTTESILSRINFRINSLGIYNALQGLNGVSLYNNCRGVKVLGSYRWIAEQKWAIIAEIEEKEIFEPIYMHTSGMMSVFLLVLFVTYPLSILMASNIEKPIQYLMRGSKDIQKRDYSLQIDKTLISSAPRELQELCITFNQMAATISEHQKQMEQEIETRTYDLQVVNKQLKQEVMERKQAECILHQSREKYRMLFNNATDAVFLFKITNNGVPGNFIEVNDGACKMLGYEKEDLLETCPSKIDTIIKKKDLHDIKKRLLANEHILYETTHVTKTGQKIPVEMNVQRFDLNGQSVGLGIARDISERKQMERELLRLDRLNLVGEMAAGIGHEVRNPMTTVRGFLQMLSRRGENMHHAEYFTIMIEELDRANSIITEFLSLAKNKAVNKKMYNLNSIIEILKPLVQADGLVHNKYITTSLAEIPDLLLDEKEIRQLILNLVRNGLEAMPSGGKLMIKTIKGNNDVVLAVQDEGCGISPNIIEKIGTPFFTTKESGTGLGLAVCYSIASRHNAAIEIKTSPKGTTFFVRFPKG